MILIRNIKELYNFQLFTYVVDQYTHDSSLHAHVHNIHESTHVYTCVHVYMHVDSSLSCVSVTYMYIASVMYITD